ncbi:MAG TPA: hypothetical protein VL463_28525 [Kofleriaceae bacterium]|nr:hypothetical protein [Kofleriaceae bacterium]
MGCAVVGLAGGVAFAQGASGSAKAGAGAAAGAGSAKAADKAAPPAMQMPKPAQELLDMTKNMGGTWKCTGKVHMPGADMDVTADIKGKMDVDKMWWHESLTQTKSKTPYKFEAYMTYDAATKTWMRVAVDNMGVVESTTSSDGKTWTGTSMGMGQKAQVKTVATPGDKTLNLVGTMSADNGKTWTPTFEMDCKK